MSANIPTWIDKWTIKPRHRRWAIWHRLTAPQLFVLSFVLLVGWGTLGLKVLPGLYTGEELSWLDALFMSTSAACVTGLAVVDPATFFTPLGQAYILLLIQLGGLGMITFTSLIIVALGRRLSLRQEAISTGSRDVAPHVNPARLLRDVVLFTFAIEGLGAVALYALWVPSFGWVGAIWPAVFHAVSAFCNAGFSTYTLQMIPFQDRPLVLGVIMGLIVVGGLGFLTLEEMWLNYQAKRRKQSFRLSLHSRIVLGMTALLLAGGFVVYLALEWDGVLGGMPVGRKATNAMFMSVTARTAGFNSVDYAKASDATNFFTILLMFIGGSPGSTAGGLKTTTVALMGLLAWSRLRGSEITSIWGRTVPEETIQRAVGLFVMSFGLVTGGILVMAATEPSPKFLAYMFEAASAFNTVGLSMGVTFDLTAGGRWMAIVLMFLGRVGPLTFAAAIALPKKPRSDRFRYSHEDVVIG